ncbi:cytochrome P450 monooxygenase [Xylariaceae sp. FL0662B]|nr:cytochrome P450 monooxygenase [Xylariaceae sp. FL0662B]
MAGNATLNIVPDMEWSSQLVIIFILFGIVSLYFFDVFGLGDSGISAPVVGKMSPYEPGWLVGLRYVRSSASMIEDGYQRFKASMFKVRRNDGSILVISHKYLDQLRSLPGEQLSSMDAQIKNLAGRYSTADILLEGDLHTRIIQQKLTPALSSLIPVMKSELDFALGAEFPDCKDRWVDVQIFEILSRIVARISARIFLGADVCRNEKWLATSVQYTENIGMVAMTLRMFPSYLHSVIAPLLPSYWRLCSNVATAKRFISPIVKARRRAAAEEGDDYVKPQDTLQWMMDAADPRDGQPEKLAHRQLVLSLASIHTTSMAAAHVIYDICAHPEYFEPLCEELEAALRSEDGWEMPTLNRLRKLDSFMKESQRTSPPSLLAFNRIVRTPLTLSDGTYLPAGTHICMASRSILNDPANLPGGGDPAVFDPFRYARLRADPENTNRFQFSSIENSNLHFGYGKFACPGRFYASSEIKMILASILLRYDLRYSEGQGRPRNLNAEENIYPDPSARVLIREKCQARDELNSSF